jgi:pilus assembly protein Flp/PilA
MVECGRARTGRDRRFDGGSVGVITSLKRLVRGDEGQDLLEYALLVALIALVAVAAITLTGTNVNQIFTNIAAALAPPAN